MQIFIGVGYLALATIMGVLGIDQIKNGNKRVRQRKEELEYQRRAVVAQEDANFMARQQGKHVRPIRETDENESGESNG